MPSDEDYEDDPGVPVDRLDVVEFQYPELSVLVDTRAGDIWVEFPDDEVEEVELACAGGPVDGAVLATLPPVTDPETGARAPLTLDIIAALVCLAEQS